MVNSKGGGLFSDGVSWAANVDRGQYKGVGAMSPLSLSLSLSASVPNIGLTWPPLLLLYFWPHGGYLK